MSPCCDDRIISSDSAHTACILIFLSCEAFYLTSAADLIWLLLLPSSVSPLISLGFLSLL